MKIRIRELTIAAACLALCLVLPLLTGNNYQLGAALSLMHIPVLICGLLTGWLPAALVGLIAPLLRFVLFTAPPILTAAAMAPELAVYGLMCALLYRALPKKVGYLYVALILSMIIGRFAWGLATLVITGIQRSGFTWGAFFAGAFVKTLPGIAVHIAIVPPIVLAVRRALRIAD